MPRKIRSGYVSKKPPIIVIPKEEASAKILSQIKLGEELLNISVLNETTLEKIREQKKVWSDYNKDLLLTLFDTDDISTEYAAFKGGAFSTRPTFKERVSYVHDDIRSSLSRLRSILSRLDLYEVVYIGNNTEMQQSQPKQLSNKVFVVHGHDEALKMTVTRLIEQLDLDPIILHEQPNKGRTIIEKFEDNSDVAFAVVLLTPDDEARSKQSTNDEYVDRARQNVILELGYFIGKLGRQNVCALYVEGVELPSDMSGVLYVKADSNDAWRLKLSQEFKAGGLKVDLNKIV